MKTDERSLILISDNKSIITMALKARLIIFIHIVLILILNSCESKVEHRKKVDEKVLHINETDSLIEPEIFIQEFSNVYNSGNYEELISFLDINALQSDPPEVWIQAFIQKKEIFGKMISMNRIKPIQFFMNEEGYSSLTLIYKCENTKGVSYEIFAINLRDEKFGLSFMTYFDSEVNLNDYLNSIDSAG